MLDPYLEEYGLVVGDDIADVFSRVDGPSLSGHHCQYDEDARQQSH